MDKVDHQFGRYKILRLLGEGATAHVYLALDTVLEREVALKVLKSALITDRQAFQRFAQEAKAVARLVHPRIAMVYDMGEQAGLFYLAMYYVNGSSMDHIIKQDVLKIDEVKKLLEQIGSALDYAHGTGLIHRDVKPSNIIRDDKGNFWLTDFGLTKALMNTGLTTNSGAILGTPPYIPPEIWLGQEATPQSDQYSLACVAYEALTGEVLFAAPTPPAVMTKHVMGKVDVCHTKVPRNIKPILLKALAREPEVRFEHVMEFAEALSAPAGETAEGNATTHESAGVRDKNLSAELHFDPNSVSRFERKAQPQQVTVLDELQHEVAPYLKPEIEQKGPERKDGLGWFPWALLGIIGLVVLGVLIGQNWKPPVQPPIATAKPTIPEEPAVVETLAQSQELAIAYDGSSQGQELANAYAGMYTGTVVSMSGPFTDQDEVLFNDSISSFEEATGIDIQYEGSKEFEGTINIRLDGGDRPDIVDFPQPGLLQYSVEKGYAIDMNTVINPAWLQQNYTSGLLDLATMTGPNGSIMGGIWARANGKSFVFYPKAEFEAAGYEVPETWDEMMTLTEQIAADGHTPWCIGIESGPATGWTMTDWIEDTLLRVAPPEDYDAWVAGTLKFDSPQVNEALDYIEAIWFNDAYVYGGRSAIPTINFGDAPKPMFENPPRCWFNRQGNFVTSFFPEEKVAGVDYDFFYLPPIKEEYGKPVLGAGDIYAVYNDRPEVRAVIQYFSMGESLKVWVEQGGAILTHNDADLNWYVDPVTRGVAETIRNATTFRFDGSDLMPGAVGAGTFWKYMTDYVSGSITREEALQQIDASWPSD